MGSKPGNTTTTTHTSPPQILNEGRQGYEEANEFYRGILENPPVYEGERIAPFAPAQQAALEQQRGFFGGPQQFQTAAENQVYQTASGNNRWQDPITAPLRDPTLGGNDYGLGRDSYGLGRDSYGLGRDNYGLTGEGFDGGSTLQGSSASPYRAQIGGVNSTYKGDPRFLYKPMTDEEMQVAIRHGSEPILADLEENVMTQIRDSSQLAGQGATSTRSDVARQKAVEGYGRTVGSSVIAPLMQQREALEQDFDKAMQSYLQATAEGDANRAEQAQIEMARINAQSHDNSQRINAERDIAGAELGVRAQEGASRERIAGAGLQSQERLGSAGLKSGERVSSAGLKSQERLGQAGLTSQERRDAAGIYSQDKNAYSERNLKGYDSERNREITAAGMSGDMLKNEAFRINQLFQSGLIDQTQYQRMLDSAREQYEEPLYRQSQAATGLSGMSGLGPGSSTNIAKQDGGGDGTMDTIMQVAQIGMMVAGAVAKCSREFKEDIVAVPNENQLVQDILQLGIKNWHYKWEPHNKMLGPILEDCPSWLHDAMPKHLNMMNLVSGLLLTIQAQNKRIERLENVLSSQKQD